jgi:NTE family protein
MTPLSSPIKLGAERIISINLKGIISNSGPEDIPNIGQIAGSVLDSMFMDAIDYDSWVMSRMNTLTEKIPVEKRDTKVIDFCRISPLANLGELAEKFRHKFPRSLRYLLGSWISSELLSYLLFDKDFSEVLIEQGMKDGKLYYDIIEEWLSDKG